jgi:hypothetical protein
VSEVKERAQVTHPRWAATVYYRHATGLVDVTHDIDEISELEMLVENGPHFDCIERIEILYKLGSTAGLTIEGAAEL